MARTLMSELEAVQSRCDRLSVSREEQAAEAEKNTKRLTEVWEPTPSLEALM